MMSPSTPGFITVFHYIPHSSVKHPSKIAREIAETGVMKGTTSHLPDGQEGPPRVNFTEVAPDEGVNEIAASTCYDTDVLKNGYCMVIRIPVGMLQQTNFPRNHAVYGAEVGVKVDKILSMQRQYQNGFRVSRN